jgi:hypothetical protein
MAAQNNGLSKKTAIDMKTNMCRKIGGKKVVTNAHLQGQRAALERTPCISKQA